MHVAVIALAVILVLGCGVSHVCAASPDALNHVTQIATAIASGALGHAGAHSHTRTVATPTAAAKETERTS